MCVLSPLYAIALFHISKKRAKIRNRYMQTPHLTQDTMGQTHRLVHLAKDDPLYSGNRSYFSKTQILYFFLWRSKLS